MIALHRRTDQTPKEQIEDGSHVEPAFRSPNVSKVGDLFAIGSRCFKGAIEHLGSDSARLTFTHIKRKATPSGSRPESLLAHQSLDPAQSTRYIVCKQIVPYTSGTIVQVDRHKTGLQNRGQLSRPATRLNVLKQALRLIATINESLDFPFQKGVAEEILNLKFGSIDRPAESGCPQRFQAIDQ